MSTALNPEANERLRSRQDASNVIHLTKRLSIDAMSALTSAALVSPIVAIIDKSIIQRTILSTPIVSTIKSSSKSLVCHPSLLATRPYLLLSTLYLSTFATANVIDTVAEEKSWSSVEHASARFIGVSVVNISGGIYKDTQLAKIFGGGAPKAVPKSTLGLFVLRDCITIFGSFSLPPLVAAAASKEEMSRRRELGMQLTIPAVIQLVSTPIHLLALDLYGSQGKKGWKDRAKVVKDSYLVSCAARVCRIVPAFGVGGVVNKGTRDWLSS